jgi:tetratricopeptide (TPR) repeat protein
MRRTLIYILLTAPLLAQFDRPDFQQAPIDALVQSYQSAYSEGRFDEAAAKRDQARALLNQTAVTDPQFANWAERVSQLYDGGGFAAQARDVLEQALARNGATAESAPARVALLNAIARSWEQDRNLLKAATYLEQALEAAEAHPQHTQQRAGAQMQSSLGHAALGAVFVTGGLSPMPVAASRVSAFFGGYGGANDEDLYRRLFNLYRQQGRPQDAAAVLTRITAHIKDSDGILASLYQQQGQTDEAAAIYKRLAEQAGDPQHAAAAWQSLAQLYQSDQRYADAATAMQQAIGKTEASGQPDASRNSVGMRQSLANIYQQAGQAQAADEVYQQLVSQPATGQPGQQVGAITSYANFLAQTGRADRAETLLKDYQSSQSSAEPWEQNNLLMALANVERISGKPQLAEEYQQRAIANQPQPTPPAGSRIGDTLQRARGAANAGKLDDAYNLTLLALDSAPAATDREMAIWMAPELARSLASKAPAKADEIYRRTFTLAESWSAVTVAPLLTVQQNYARFLESQKRWSEFEQTVEHYRATLTAARGAGTGWLEDALRLRTEVLYQAERRPDALVASQELVKLDESLGGATSEPYERAIEALANAMETTGDRAGALPLRRKTVTIADLVYPAGDLRRASIRMNAAMAFAHDGQFDEAERLAKEAVAKGEQVHPRMQNGLASQLQQILQMKQAAQSASAAKQ